jgi:hypothetical protein
MESKAASDLQRLARIELTQEDTLHQINLLRGAGSGLPLPTEVMIENHRLQKLAGGDLRAAITEDARAAKMDGTLQNHATQLAKLFSQ